MKVAVKEAPKAFEPITLTITIETREELLDMWARHMIGNLIVVNNFHKGGETKGISNDEIIAACQKTPLKPPILAVLRQLVGGDD